MGCTVLINSRLVQHESKLLGAACSLPGAAFEERFITVSSVVENEAVGGVPATIRICHLTKQEFGCAFHTRAMAALLLEEPGRQHSVHKGQSGVADVGPVDFR